MTQISEVEEKPIHYSEEKPFTSSLNTCQEAAVERVGRPSPHHHLICVVPQLILRGYLFKAAITYSSPFLLNVSFTLSILSLPASHLCHQGLG
jgi:hypothetical protein